MQSKLFSKLSQQTFLDKRSMEKGRVKFPHSHKCYINMLMYLNNWMQHAEQKGLNTFHS